MNRTIRRWLARLLWDVRHASPRFKAKHVENLPVRLMHDTVYVVGDEECVWVAAMLCPCGCSELIQLSLATDACPSWTVTLDGQGIPTLLPSVWRTAGCKSHFILYRGHVFWCRDDEEFPGSFDRWA